MARIDEEIKKDVVDKLYWDDRVDASNLKVEVNRGEVILSGEVPSYSSRKIAHNDTITVPGVRSVKNRVLVKYPQSTPLPSDEEIQFKINDSFRLDPDLDSNRIDVSVIDGKVRIQGEVDAFWKKALAENLASGIIGVVDITNDLQVVPTKDIVDSAIADDLKFALKRNIFVDLNDIEYKVEDGVVTLMGAVPDWISARAAYNTALYTAGVVDVNNNITIHEPS